MDKCIKEYKCKIDQLQKDLISAKIEVARKEIEWAKNEGEYKIILGAASIGILILILAILIIWGL